MTHRAVREVERRTRRFVPDQLRQHPSHIADRLRKRYVRTAERDGTPAANVELRTYTEKTRYLTTPDAGDDAIRAWARHRARECWLLMMRHGDDWARYAVGREMVGRFGFEPPAPGGDVQVSGCVARMGCERWWRRRLRTEHGRQMEREARALGLVHKRAGLYVSHDCYRRVSERWEKNAQTLADADAVCEDTGEVFNLGEIAQAGPANPRNRRAELMTRVRGLEECAERRGHVGLFVTWTVPPEWHAVSSERLEPGEGARVSPREAQDWLKRRWASARAELSNRRLHTYGLRVAEPHHDGTPHWHLLLFVPYGDAAAVQSILEDKALAGDERPARRKHACKTVRIDASRGSAAGYVAKYVAKCVDGEALQGIRTTDDAGNEVWLDRDAADTAARVRAWASQWGIRQFQFFGCPPVTIWRELRRLDGPIRYNDTAESIRYAADNGEWGRYVELMGGPAAVREAHPARARYMADTGTGRYGEPRYKPFIECAGRPYVTRPLSWRIEYRPNTTREGQAHQPSVAKGTVKGAPAGPAVRSQGIEYQRGGEAGAPWTRGNNCNRPPAGDTNNGSPPGRPPPGRPDP